MRIVSAILFSFLSALTSFSQIINSSFIAPDTVCVNQTFTIQNTSTGSINSTYWNFCSSSVTLVQSVNLGSSSNVSFPVFASIQNDAGVYYMFVSNNGNGNLTRYTFGSSLNNIPVIVNLGNLGGQMPFAGEGIFIEQEGSNWYGVTVGGPNGSDRITRLNFGTSLANTPTAVNMGNLGGMNYPHRLQIIHAGGNKYGFTINRSNNTITRFDFGASLNNVPVATNLGNIGSLSGPSDIAFISDNGNWYAFITNDGTSTVTRLSFGNSLLNTPTGNNLGNPGFSGAPRGISLDVTCGGIRGQITTLSNIMYNVDFPTGPTGTITISSIGNPAGFVFPHNIEKFRVKDTVYTFISNANGNSISRLKYASCINPSMPSSTLTNLPPLTFTAAGVYTISILNNSNQYNQSVYCKTIAVTGNTIVASASPSTGCSTGFTTTLTVAGSGTFTWNPGSTVGNTVVVTPTATTIYTASTTSTLNCGNSQTLAISVVTTPTLNTNATSFTICSGQSTTLSANGATTYTWLPGNATGTSVVVSPTATTIYTVTGLNGGLCSDTKTIQIDVNPTPTVVVNPLPAVICLNNTITLTASGANNYTWAPSAGLSNTNTAIVQASPTVTTIYTVQGLTAAGCSSLAVMAVTVLPLPTVSIAGTTTFCSSYVPNSTTLQASGAGTYSWSLPSGFFASPNATSNPVVITAPSITSSVVATVTVLGTAGTCTNDAVFTLTVYPSPTVTAISSTNQICAGNSVTLSATGANSYTWTPGFITGSTTVVNPNSTTTYTLTGANIFWCTNTATVAVTVNATPTINISFSSPYVCTGQTLTLTASGASSYTWLPGPLTGSVYIDAPTLPTGQYTLFGSNGNCTGAAAATILVVQTPTTLVSASQTTICSGQTPTLFASGADTYSWSPSTFLSSQTGSVVVSTPSSGICYTVTGYDPLGGCPSTATVCLNVQPTPTVNITSIPGVICTGEQGSLEGSGATSYTWMPTSSNNTNIIVTPTTTTTYTLYGQTGACIGNSVVTVTVNPTPTLSALVTTPTLCLGKNTDMFVSGASSFTWEPGSVFGSSTNVSPTINTTYTVTGNSLNCFSSQTVNVIVVQNPTLNIVANPTLTCLDPLKTATLTAGGASTFTWLPTSASSQTLAISPSVALQYTVSGTNSNGCVSSSTIGLNVDPDLHSGISDTSICAGSTINLLASGAVSYNWLPGNFIQSTINTIPEASTVYTITGTSGLCSKTETVYVEVITNPIHEIPEVFTPNDDGKNDHFVIRSDAQTKIDIKVFNRWGALVYSHAEYDNSWDGTAKGDMVLGHNKLPAGTYYYVIDLESCDKQIIRGYVVIQY